MGAGGVVNVDFDHEAVLDEVVLVSIATSRI